MPDHTSLKIGITCYPSVGGSGILAISLGQQLAERGHEMHFICYERPFRLAASTPRVHFHEVTVSDYKLFKYPDYTLPLSVKVAEVSREHRLDILHVQYAVPHATAAILAQSMCPPAQRPRVVTTLHGTDVTLLGTNPQYGPAIRHAVETSDAVTAVSGFLKAEAQRLLHIERPIEVIHNFYEPATPARSRQDVRQELGIAENEVMLLHTSNLRPVKRIDLLLEAVAQIRPRDSFKLAILAGENFAPFADEVRRLGLHERVVVRERVFDVENYVQAADLGLVTSQSESFCLSILEAMNFACPSVATSVGGIPEVIDHNRTGILVPFGDATALARSIETLIENPAQRHAMGRAAKLFARQNFAAHTIVPRYEALYRSLIS